MASTSRERSSGSLSEQLRALVPEGRGRSFRAGEIIFAAGDSGDGFYVVESGSVRISAVIDQNEPRVLATIGPGEFFGEMAVLDDAPRSASAIADEETQAVFIERDQLLGLLERQPHLALALIREFSARMRALNQKYLDEIIQAERLAAVGRFAGTIVHDFKNPLTVIGLASEIAFQEGVPVAIKKKSQGRIAQQIQRITDMLHELIDFTKPSGARPNLQRTQFAAFMNPLVEMISDEIAERKVALVLEDPAPELEVEIDAQRLSRVFHNLINNAVDEMRGGGTVFLRFKVSEIELTVSVQDTGKGIAPEIAQTLFKPFATHGKTHGTGLGLSICKKIVEDHHGRIWAGSAPGKGATFSFTLPLAR
ncbi:MAG: ATP-binding protein [Opitutaceae bacterium]